MSTIIWIVILIVALAAGIGAGYFIGYNNRKKTAEAQIGSAEAEATRLVNEAIKTAEQKRKEAVLEAENGRECMEKLQAIWASAVFLRLL